MSDTFVLMTVLALALAAVMAGPPQRVGTEMGERVAALLADFDDADLGKGAHIELSALGTLAAPALARAALADWSVYERALPYLRTHEASARLALLAAVERAVALEPTLPADRLAWASRRAVGEYFCAVQLAADLAPYVKDATTLCAPLLVAATEFDRLRVRCGFARDTDVRKLVDALSVETPAALEVALELLRMRDTSTAKVWRQAVQDLWDQRNGLQLSLSDATSRPVDYATVVEALLARAIVVLLPDDQRVGDAWAALLSSARLPFEVIEMLEHIATLGPRAEAAVGTVTRLCYASDDKICRAALDTLARLGACAEAALADVEHRAEHAADPETRRLAQIAKRRIAQPDDVASLALDLVDDLAHPSRGERAQRDLLHLGAPAAKALLAALGDKERRLLWPCVIELLHTLHAAAEPELRALLASPPADFAHATWNRLRVVVDLTAPASLDGFLVEQIARWAEQDPDRAPRCEALRARAEALRHLTASDADLAVALASAAPAVVERAARVLLARGQASPDLCAALATAFLRQAPVITTNEDDLRLGAAAPAIVARALLALDPAPPPTAFDTALATDTASERLARLRQLPKLPWPPEVKLARLLPLLGDDQVDAVRIAALDAFTKTIPADHPTPDSIERLATIRWNRALARAAQRACAR